MVTTNPGFSETKTPKASVHTLGCRLNQSETNLIREKLVAAGFSIVPFGEEADLAVINTCTITRLADSKSRRAIRSFTRRNPQAFTAVVGCYSQMGYNEVAKIPGVDLIIGTQEKLNVLEYASLGKNATPLIIRDRIVRDDFTIAFTGEGPAPQRANLKIQDGCNFMCSFCIIPFARGRARSRDFENLMDEARSLVDRNVREIILTGVNIGTYEREARSILDVIDALAALPGLERIRISSIEPTTIPVELFELMRDPAHKLMPFLHIPLQSGSDRILTSMKRKYSVAEFLGFLELAAAEVPGICLGTDIMVGYPGEDEADFAETCRVFMEHPFSFCHVFTFSERAGTPAASHANPVSHEERTRRSVLLRKLSEQKRIRFYRRHLGETRRVLFENEKEGYWPGYTDNFIRVAVRADLSLMNRLGDVHLQQTSADTVEGDLVKTLE